MLTVASCAAYLVHLVAVLTPGRAQQLQALPQLDRRVLGNRQRLAVRLLVAGDLQNADERPQRPAQIMAEEIARAQNSNT